MFEDLRIGALHSLGKRDSINKNYKKYDNRIVLNNCRAPVRGSGKRRQWVTNLFSTPELDVTYDNLYYLCQLHFNPDDIEPMKAHGGKVGYKLKPGALPLPIKKPADQWFVQAVRYSILRAISVFGFLF